MFNPRHQGDSTSFYVIRVVSRDGMTWMVTNAGESIPYISMNVISAEGRAERLSEREVNRKNEVQVLEVDLVSGTVKPVSIFKKGKFVWSERKKN